MDVITLKNFADVAPHTAQYDGNSITLYDNSSNKIRCDPVNTKKIGDLLVFKYEFSQVFVDSRTGEYYISRDVVISDFYLDAHLCGLRDFAFTTQNATFYLDDGDKLLLNPRCCMKIRGTH